MTNKSGYLGGTVWTGQARNKAPQGMHTLIYVLISCACLTYSNWDVKYNKVNPLFPRAEVNSTELQRWTIDKPTDVDPDKTAASNEDSGIIHLPQNQRALKNQKIFLNCMHLILKGEGRTNDVKHKGNLNLNINLGKCYEEFTFSPQCWKREKEKEENTGVNNVKMWEVHTVQG